MRLGLGSYAYAWAIGIAGYPPASPMDVFAFVQRASELGLRVVQIADNLPLHTLNQAEIERLIRETQALGIQVEVGTRGISPEHLITYLELAQAFESPILRVVTTHADHHPAPDEIVTVLRGVMPEFERAGVTLAIENHDSLKVKTLVSILQQIDSPSIGICLDTVNSLGVAEGPEVVVDVLGPYVVNLHVKDFTIRRHRHMLGFEIEGTPVGQGMLDVPWLLDKLPRDCNAILETWPPPESSVEATIRKEDAWVVESLRYLRNFIQA